MGLLVAIDLQANANKPVTSLIKGLIEAWIQLVVTFNNLGAQLVPPHRR